MTRTVPVSSQQSPGNFLTSALWNSQVKGIIDWTTGPPRFSGYNTTSTAPASGVEYVVPLDSEDYDSEGGHSTTTNNTRYTVQVAGLYLVTAHLAFTANATGMRVLDLKVNGSIAPGGRVSSGVPTTSVSCAMCVAVHVQLNVGDYLEMSCTQYSGSALALAYSAAYNPRMTLHWVSN